VPKAILIAYGGKFEVMSGEEVKGVVHSCHCERSEAMTVLKVRTMPPLCSPDETGTTLEYAPLSFRIIRSY
jgi:hypothetical protein